MSFFILFSLCLFQAAVVQVLRLLGAMKAAMPTQFGINLSYCSSYVTVCGGISLSNPFVTFFASFEIITDSLNVPANL